jgi:tetratricopeptide (TPR) repeat protein
VSYVSLILAAGLCAASASALAQDLDPQDLENRIEFAHFTEDAAALRNLIRGMEEALAKGAPISQMHYLLGFAHYRLGNVLASKDEVNAVKALSKCVEEVDETTEADEHVAEGYALEAAFLGQLSGLRGMMAKINGPKSASRLEKALKLAPKNPRVVLVDGLSDYRNGDKARALSKLRRAAELFDQSAPNPAVVPSWGHADVYAALGRSLLETGDTLGARNAVEGALIVAPEFAAAKRLLAQVTGTH